MSFGSIIAVFLGAAAGIAMTAFLIYSGQRREQYNPYSSAPAGRAVEYNYSSPPRRRSSPVEDEQMSISQENSRRTRRRRSWAQEICAVCLELVSNEFFTECCHQFHYTCINKWKRESDFCPVCRTAM